MKPFAIAPYPLSTDYREEVAASLGSSFDLLDVPSLRRLGVGTMLRMLQQHRGAPCVIALEDPSSAPLLPVLELLALLAMPSSIAVIDASGTSSSISRLRAAASAAGLLEASIAVRRSAAAARRELRTVSASPRLDARLGASRVVLYVNGNLWFGVRAGGSIGHVAGVINGLLDADFDVEVAAVAPQPLVRDSAKLVRLEPPRRFGMPSELNQILFSRSIAHVLGAATGRGSHAFLYQRMSLGNYAGVMVSRRARIPLVLEYNGSEVWIARNWGTPLRHEELALRAEDVSLRHAHVILTVSQVLGDELLARGVEPERVVVYPNCVDPEVFDPERLSAERDRRRSELGLADHSVVTFVGTFGRWHGAEVLAKAINAMAVNEPGWLEQHRVRFLLVGDGLRMPQVREALGEAGHRVTTLAGLVPQADAPSYLAASDVLVSPHVPNEDGSRFFGSPTKLFEYMAMGKAIVASDLDQIGDVLRPAIEAAEFSGGAPTSDGALAILCPPGDVGALTTGIKLAVENRAWRDVLGANARRRVLERYTWDHHVRAILDRLEAVSGRG